MSTENMINIEIPEEEIKEYSVYARVDEDNKVNHIFSSYFEKPLETDVLIKTGYGDEFIHVGYYDIFTVEGARKYKIKNNVLAECTKDEIANEIAAISNKETYIADLNDLQSISGGKLSEVGWYRIAKYPGGEGGDFANSCEIIIKRASENTESEYHNLKLVSVTSSYEFQPIISKSATQLINKIRYTYDENCGYIEIYYSGDTEESVHVSITKAKDYNYKWSAIVPELTSGSIDSVTEVCSYDILSEVKLLTSADSGDMEDAKTLNGLSAEEFISNKNVLINPYFINPVNISGKTEWKGSGEAFNCWKIVGADITVTSEDDGVVISNSGTTNQFLVQFIDEDVLGDNITLSIKSSEEKKGISVKNPVAGKSTKCITLKSKTLLYLHRSTPGKLQISIQIPAGVTTEKIEWVKVESGSVATPFIIPNMEIEKIKCGIIDLVTHTATDLNEEFTNAMDFSVCDYNSTTLNTPYSEKLTTATQGKCITFKYNQANNYAIQMALTYGGTKIFARKIDNGSIGAWEDSKDGGNADTLKNRPISEDGKRGIPYIPADYGAIEIGKYIDFHTQEGKDYDARLYLDGTKLRLQTSDVNSLLATLTDLDNYMPKSGGKLTGELTAPQINLKKVDDNGQSSIYKNHSSSADYGLNLVDTGADGKSVKLNIRNDLDKVQFANKAGSVYDVLHTGNMSNHVILKSGGEINGKLLVAPTANWAQYVFKSANGYYRALEADDSRVRIDVRDTNLATERRYLDIFNKTGNPDIKYALHLVEESGGETKGYPVLHTGNYDSFPSKKWATARNINGMQVNGEANRVNYGTCSTAAGTAAKVVSCTGFALITGAEITVKFTVTNTAANPTLNVNNTGAKAIYYRGAAISAGYLAANRTYTFRYNGTQYDLVGDLDTNTTYSLSSLGVNASAAELNHVKGVTSPIQTQLNGKQPNLGFTPVQQGGGTNQGSNKVMIGWTGTTLDVMIDETNMGTIMTSGTAKSQVLPLTRGGTGATSAANARTNLGLGAAATKAVDTAIKSGSDNLITSGAVYSEINSLKNSVSDGKKTVANAITAKGVTTATDASFATMATNIAAIETAGYAMPAAITVFSGSVVGCDVTFSWTLPSDANRSGVMIRYATGSAPSSATAGTLLYDSNTYNGTSATSKVFTFGDTGTYYCTIFTYTYVNNVRYYTKGASISVACEKKIGFQRFTSSGTFTVPSGVTSVDVFIVGGGAFGETAQYISESEYESRCVAGVGGNGGIIHQVSGHPVTPGDSISVEVAAHGQASMSSFDGIRDTAIPSGMPGYGQTDFIGIQAGGGQPAIMYNSYGGDTYQNSTSGMPGRYAFSESWSKANDNGIRYGAGGGGGGYLYDDKKYSSNTKLISASSGGETGGGAGSSNSTGGSAIYNTGSGGGGGAYYIVRPTSGATTVHKYDGGPGASGCVIVRWGY